MVNPSTPRVRVGYSPDQLAEMASDLTGCSVELDAILPRCFAVSTKKILIDRKVPGQLLADVLLGAIHRLFTDRGISSEDTQPLRIPVNVVPLQRRQAPAS